MDILKQYRLVVGQSVSLPTSAAVPSCQGQHLHRVGASSHTEPSPPHSSPFGIGRYSTGYEKSYL